MNEALNKDPRLTVQGLLADEEEKVKKLEGTLKKENDRLKTLKKNASKRGISETEKSITENSIENSKEKIRAFENEIKNTFTSLRNTIVASLDGKPKDLKTEVSSLFESLHGALMEEERLQQSQRAYPQHTAVQIILAFFCSKFNTQDDILNLLTHLGDDFVDVEKIPKGGNRLTNKDAQEIIEKNLPLVQSGKDISLTIDEMLALSLAPSFSNPYPYVDDKLISNGNAYPYDQSKKQRLTSLTFADCVETTVRHLFNLLCYRADHFSLDHLKDQIPQNFFEKLNTFYDHQSVNLANAGDEQTRSLWNEVIGDLNPLLVDHPFSIAYMKEKDGYQYELDAGFGNLIHVFHAVLGIRKDAFPESAPLSEQQKWVTDSLEGIFKILSPQYEYKFHLKDGRVKEGTSRKDLSGTMGVSVYNNEQLLFNFDLFSEQNAHSQIEKLKAEGLKNLTEDSESILRHATIGDLGKESRNAAEEIIWTLSRANLDKIHSPLFQIFAHRMEDDQSRINALSKISKTYQHADESPLGPFKDEVQRHG